MGYDLELAERVRAMLADHDEITEREMFGGMAFLLHGHMTVVASGRGGLMIRADPERTAELAESTPAVLAEMRGQVMKSWLRIASSELDGRAQLRTWVDLALAHTATLPPKT